MMTWNESRDSEHRQGRQVVLFGDILGIIEAVKLENLGRDKQNVFIHMTHTPHVKHQRESVAVSLSFCKSQINAYMEQLYAVVQYRTHTYT